MVSIANLSNYVLAAGAMNNLKKCVYHTDVDGGKMLIHRLRNKQPRYFSSLPLFHRAARMISTNHYQAPVRRFILDLFDVPLDSDTLVQLVTMEQKSLRLIAQRRRGEEEGRSSRRSRTSGTGQTPEREMEHRRRSASSPGPEPPGRNVEVRKRNRGLTISTMEHQPEEGSEVEPRSLVLGGF